MKLNRTNPDKLANESDVELLRRFVNGRDDCAFTCLVARHSRMVLGACYRLLQNNHDAEDASQAVFVTLAARANSLQHAQSLAGWLYGVAVRISLNLRRSNRRWERAKEQAMIKEETNREFQREPDVVCWLDEELSKLPPKYREPIVLCDLQACSQGEASRWLGIPLGTVSSRLVRGRRMLRSALTRRGVALTVAGMSVAFDQARSSNPAVAAETTARAVRNASAYLTRGEPRETTVEPIVLSLVDELMRTLMIAKLKLTVLTILMTLGIVLGSPILISNLRFAPTTNTIHAADIPFQGFNWTGYPTPWDRGQVQVIDNSLVLTPPTAGKPLFDDISNYWEIGSAAQDSNFRNPDVAVQIRGPQANTTVAGIGALDTYHTSAFAGHGVYFYHAIDGPDNYFRLFYDENGKQTTLAMVGTSLSHQTQDLKLRLVVDGLNVTAFAWPAAEPAPESPTAEGILPASFANAQGRIALFAGGRTTTTPMTFRNIVVVPEPAVSVVLLCPLLLFVRGELRRLR